MNLLRRTWKTCKTRCIRWFPQFHPYFIIFARKKHLNCDLRILIVISALQLWSQDDRKIFNFDIADLEWSKFLDNWTTGCRQFVFKVDSTKYMFSDVIITITFWYTLAIVSRPIKFQEPLSSLPEARRRQNRLWWIERIISVKIILNSIKKFSSYEKFLILAWPEILFCQFWYRTQAVIYLLLGRLLLSILLWH